MSIGASLLFAAAAFAALLACFADLAPYCPETDGDEDFSCSLAQVLIYGGLAAALLIALPLGLAGLLGEMRRDGEILWADEEGVRLGTGGVWDGPLAWHSIRAVRVVGSGITARLGIDLISPDRSLEDLGRPLGSVEKWRIKHGGPALIMPAFRLDAPAEEVRDRLIEMRERRR